MKRPRCVDCRYYRPDGAFGRCHAPENELTGDTVGDGHFHARYDFAHSQRMGSWLAAIATNCCGPQGRFFEPLPATPKEP